MKLFLLASALLLAGCGDSCAGTFTSYVVTICHDGDHCVDTKPLDAIPTVDAQGCMIVAGEGESHIWCNVHLAIKSKTEEPKCATAPEIDTPEAWNLLGKDCMALAERKHVQCDCVVSPLECFSKYSDVPPPAFD
jgi:hypothetical protein